ncbi:Choloylglycine hydrolase [Lactiplantibacillus plantarum subsp. plantarum]|uniref:Choloylglycine hydrolase n=1 Tax=Lactiplantibacillus plantarum subsp. plantarum TaxID=337330 RepID=A0A2S3U8L6_LACPN|nr:Choloylglycine hydrolase [Lactiplantibacillus plantarum subsp. plantarum]
MSKYIRQATSADLPAMMAITEQAKTALAADQIPQWQDGYPQSVDLQADIDAKLAWVLIVDGQIAGTATLLTTPDPTMLRSAMAPGKKRLIIVTLQSIASPSQMATMDSI